MKYAEIPNKFREYSCKGQKQYNTGKSETDINKGDKVMLKWKMVQDSLQAKYDSPFEVLERMDRMSSYS